MQRRLNVPRLKRWLKDHEMTQVGLATELGTGRAYLSFVMSAGLTGPELLCKLLERTKLSIQELVIR